MTRDEMIDYLIEDYINMCDCDRIFFEEILLFGWKGLEDWSDKDIQDDFENLEPSNFDKDDAEKIKVEQKRLTVYNNK